MSFKSLEYLNDIEKLINETHDLPIFKGYKAINKRGVEKLIDEIYSSLSVDVAKAQQYLASNNINQEPQKNANLFNHLKKLKTTIDDSAQFMNYIIVNVKEIEMILDKIYSGMPQEITFIQKQK